MLLKWYAGHVDYIASVIHEGIERVMLVDQFGQDNKLTIAIRCQVRSPLKAS